MRINVLRYFDQPHNSFGKWLALPLWQSYLPLFLLTLPIIYLLTAQYAKNQQALMRLQNDVAQLQQRFIHQQKLSHHLRQQLSSPILEKGADLSLANQKIQQLSQQYQLHIQHQRWFFTPQANLQLQVTGHYVQLVPFLFHLLQDNSIQLLKLKVQQHTEKNPQHSIFSEIHLRLQRK
ncbi:hypothetical protein [Volucribacter amazonae]|uniref:Competence protein C n=1 Tax=Volucribacter amazonae TaxID=256731 RepID=A0A9X4PEA8_9PAST|nr:hypothetical protein [Volucribacter amazonae]MDG6896079.1 hypothetical protein [Volucribacter amazonae]